MTPTAALEERLGHRFGDRTILERALTHRSRAHEVRATAQSADYERMEFLGDALLGFLVSERLMRDDPDADEGTLTQRRQALVSTIALARISDRLGLGGALRLGRGEAATGGGAKPSLLADAFESVLAAVYLDGGVRAARAFIHRHLKDEFLGVRSTPDSGTDAKTRLQELVQARDRSTPRYRTVSTTGPAHDRRFTAEVLVGDRVAGTGTGSSRKNAEREAARMALEALAAARPEGVDEA